MCVYVHGREKHEQQHLRGDTYIKRFAHFSGITYTMNGMQGITSYIDTTHEAKRKIIGNVYWIFFSHTTRICDSLWLFGATISTCVVYMFCHNK